MNYLAREENWGNWMRSAIAGDSIAYHRLLSAVTPFIRAVARNRCQQFGAPASEAEDVVQEVLLAIHLKRGTWDTARPLGPWIAAIVRNKVIDSLRRRGRNITVPLENVIGLTDGDERDSASDHIDMERILGRLKDPQRTIVRSISIDGFSVRQTAEQLKMTEVAVRVSLHRALKGLAAIYSERANENG